MSNYIRLTKILLKNGFGGSVSKNSKSKKKRTNQTLLIAVVLVAMFPLFFMFFEVSNMLYDALVMVGQQGLIPTLGFWIASMVIFVFGFFYIINIFYFSKDIENLLPLPLRPSEIMAAKFTVALIYEYLTEAYVLLPLLISFGIKNGGGITYIVYSLVIFITLPIIPLVYAAIVNMIIMRFTNVGKNKDKFKLIGGIFAMFLGIGINIVMQKFASSSLSPEKLQELIMKGNNSLVGSMTYIFPSNKPAALAVTNAANMSGLVNLLFYIAFVIVFAVIFLTLGEMLYFKGVIGISETSSKRKKLSKTDYDKAVVQAPVMKSYILKEIRLLLRTPIYFMNCILINFLLPVFMLIPFFTDTSGASDLGSFFSLFQNSEYAGIIVAAAFGVSIFVSATNGITSTSVSREGSNVYFTKYIPVSYKEQILGKVLTGVIISTLGVLMMLILAAVLAKMPVYLLLLGLIAGILGTLFTSMSGILIDLRGPKLDWDNEQKAVKQNFNSIINMLIGIIVAAVVVIPMVIFRFDAIITFVIIAAAFIIVDFVVYKIVMTQGVKYFEEIEG